jgi:hypothetical protein
MTTTETSAVPAPPLTAVQCITAVMQTIGAVGKSGRAAASQGGYEYRRFDDIVNAAQPAMAAVGLVLITDEVLSVDYVEVETGSRRTAMASVRVRVRYRWYGPGGDFVLAESVGEAMDSGDKATSKAMTVCYRTCITQTFALPTASKDPEEDVYERSGRDEPAGRTYGQDPERQGPPRPDPWTDRVEQAILDGPDAIRALWKDAFQGGAGKPLMDRMADALRAASKPADPPPGPPAPASGDDPAPDPEPAPETPAEPAGRGAPENAAAAWFAAHNDPALKLKMAKWQSDLAAAIKAGDPNSRIWDNLLGRAAEWPPLAEQAQATYSELLTATAVAEPPF